jgi:hypothetical protein
LNGAILLANPKTGLPIVDMCAPEGKGSTRSDDKIFPAERPAALGVRVIALPTTVIGSTARR